MEKPAVKQINISPLFRKCGLNTPDYVIHESPDMYPFKNKLDDNWAYYTIAAFLRLGSILQSVVNLAIIGIGSGVEGIAALKIFQSSIKNLVVTDIDKDIVYGAAGNIEPVGVNIIPLVGSFAEPLAVLPFKQDFIYGNIPNLPSGENQKLESGEDRGTFVASAAYDKYHVPKKYEQWALASQYAYLQSAKQVLGKQGSVFTELGGRIPLCLVSELFADCGLKISEVLVGFKEQTEALIDFEGYHKLEKNYGISFDFYLYKESLALMEKRSIVNSTFAVSGEQLKLLLKPLRVNAGQALELYRSGIAVGHTVHIFRGQHL